MLKNKKGEHFQNALVVVFAAIFISIVAFSTETGKITGFAVSDSGNSVSSNAVSQNNLREYSNINELGSLAPGSYYIDGDGIVYWLDDSSKPAVAKVDSARDNQKYRQIYIDDKGNIGYVIQ